MSGLGVGLGRCWAQKGVVMPNEFDDFSFAENPDPRCPVVLVLDVSDSMGQKWDNENQTPIDALNEGLDLFVTQLAKDDLARRRVEVAVVTFGSTVTVETGFETVTNLAIPVLETRGLTSLGEAVETAVELIETRKQTYRDNGIAYYRPWVVLVTDGAATDSITTAASLISEAETNKKLAFFVVGVEGADFEMLNQLSTRQPLKLDGLKFSEMFMWLSTSQTRVSSSTPGDTIDLPSPTGWAAL